MKINPFLSYNDTVSKSILLVGFLVMFSGCSLFQEQEQKENAEVENLKSLQERVKALNPEYEWLNADIKVKVETPERTLRGSGDLKIRKDSVIWLSISAALGIEVLRAKITPDSFKVLNRLKNEYMIKRFDFINNYTGTRKRKLAFQNVANIFLGQPFFPITIDHKLTMDSTSVSLRKEGEVLNEQIGLLPDYLKTKTYKLKKPATGQGLSIKYSDYEQVRESRLPGNISLLARKPARFHLDLTLKNLTFLQEDQAIFSVPSHYEQVR